MNGDDYSDYPDERDDSFDLSQEAADSYEDYLASIADESRLRQTLAINDAMKREADSLQTQWHQPLALDAPGYQEGRGIGVLPLQASLPPRNRIYMGPMTGAPGASPQEFFGNAPAGTNINLMAPPVITGPEANARMESAGLIQPPSAVGTRLTPLDTSWTPAYEQWSAQQNIKADMDRGYTAEQAFIRNPAAIIYSSRIPRDTERVVGPGETLYRNGIPVGSVPSKITPVRPTQAVINLHKSLIATELMAVEKQDATATAVARKNRLDFEAQHPELGLVTSPFERTTPLARSTTLAAEEKVSAPTKATDVRLPKITTKDQYDALPDGTVYVGKDGKRYRKPFARTTE